jgi:hypothetical protein
VFHRMGYIDVCLELPTLVENNTILLESKPNGDFIIDLPNIDLNKPIILIAKKIISKKGMNYYTLN